MDKLDSGFAWRVSLIAGAALILIVGGLFTYYTSKAGPTISNNSTSVKRLDELDEIMSGILGRSWPIVLLVFVIILSLALFFLYQIGKKHLDDLVISNKYARIIQISLIGAVILFAIFIILISVRYYQKMQQANLTGTDKNFIPNISQNKKETQELLLVAGASVVLVLAGMAIWYFWTRNSTDESPDQKSPIRIDEQQQ